MTDAFEVLRQLPTPQGLQAGADMARAMASRHEPRLDRSGCSPQQLGSTHWPPRSRRPVLRTPRNGRFEMATQTVLLLVRMPFSLSAGRNFGVGVWVTEPALIAEILASSFADRVAQVPTGNSALLGVDTRSRPTKSASRLPVAARVEKLDKVVQQTEAAVKGLASSMRVLNSEGKSAAQAWERTAKAMNSAASAAGRRRPRERRSGIHSIMSVPPTGITGHNLRQDPSSMSCQLVPPPPIMIRPPRERAPSGPTTG
jgi:hypothetical protein